MKTMTNVWKLVVSAFLAGTVGSLLPVLITSGAALSLMTQAVIYAIGTLGVAFLLRQNGTVSFGHAAYYGLCCYGIGLFSNYVKMPMGTAIITMILMTGVFAFVVGLVIVRVPGIAFAMITLAIGQVFYNLMSKARGVTGGADGFIVDLPRQVFGLSSKTYNAPESMFVVCWLSLVVVMFVLSLTLKTRFGPLTEAIRENEERTRFIGFTTVVPRAAVYAISAMLCAIAGALSILYTGFVSPDSLHWSLSGSFLIAALIGGSSRLSGAVIGGVVYFLLRNVLSEVTTHWLSILGVCLILMIVLWPEGIVGGLTRGAEKLRTIRGKKSV